MELKISTKWKFLLLYILSWIIFVGLAIEAGGFITGIFFTLANPAVVKNLWLWQAVDLSALFNYSHTYFLVTISLISMVAVLKAVLFYQIIRIIHGKKLNMSRPFNKEVGRFVFKVSYLALGIGLFSWFGLEYAEWLMGLGIKMPAPEQIHMGGADVWLFMGITLLVIAQIFKRGVEIQAENELTI